MKAIESVANATRKAGYKSAKAVLAGTHFVGYVTCQASLQLEMKLNKDVDPVQVARERTEKSHARMQRIIGAASSVVKKQKDIASNVSHRISSVVHIKASDVSAVQPEEVVMVESVTIEKPIYAPQTF